ncbi:DNA polymerase III subunit delta' [Glycocaulis alkaliphilus]|nr:DNA polymerase III subunit delta' [Glycocaulis alkaliphilus]GGB75456.1 DNA polymerase III subunit delta' [Glycocaulis alkaliphilus]
MSDDALPEADAEPGLPHPRHVHSLLGHEHAEAAAASAIRSGRMHHAWMITGPKGVGKATLAWRMARRLLGVKPDPSAPLAHAPGDPVNQRMEALSHPDLLLVRRPYDEQRKRLKGEITIEEARRIPAFFSRRAAEGGWRVAVIDSADEMNRNAANGLLKSLEEPPERGILILVVTSPGRLPTTVRSRCRRLHLRAGPEAHCADWLEERHSVPGEEAALLARLAKGAPGRALAFHVSGLAGMQRDLTAAFSPSGRIDQSGAERLISKATGTDSHQARAVLFDMMAGESARRARDAASKGDSAQAGQWADASRRITSLAREAETLYLDPRQSLLAAFSLLEDAARQSAA